MSDREERQPKFGEGALSAAARTGLEELRAAVYTESNVAQPTEYGMYGTLTPGEVAESRRSDERDLDEEPNRDSVLAKWMGRDREGRQEPARESREMERE